MKNRFLFFSVLIVGTLLFGACSKSDEAQVIPVSAEAKAMYAKNMALINSLKGSWNTDLVKKNGLLLYSKSNSKTNQIDYSNFKIDLKEDSFYMKDEVGNIIEGTWFVTEGKYLSLEYTKRDAFNLNVSPFCENSCGGKIIVTIRFDIVKPPLANALQIQNDNLDYTMRQ